ncbi:MAG TPA: hypothetical protein VGR57_02780 [Ktedonobacterales bacterium]|nr:hypothetical protein [Ktedonobacterales bacterium]
MAVLLALALAKRLMAHGDPALGQVTGALAGAIQAGGATPPTKPIVTQELASAASAASNPAAGAGASATLTGR